LEHLLDDRLHLGTLRQVETQATNENFPAIRPVLFLDKTEFRGCPHTIILGGQPLLYKSVSPRPRSRLIL
jgi:hypothetical protein